MGYFLCQDGKCLLFLFVIMIISLPVKCSPPEDPIKCTNGTKNCTITNSYGAFPDRRICRAAEVAYPTSEDELVAIVAGASKENRKMKVATRFSHSIPKLVCPDDDGDGGDTGSLLISTKYLNRTLKIDNRSMTVTVESGVTLRQLIEEAAKAGLAVTSAPYWWGLTVGGMMGTGAHGSSLWGLGSSVHDYVAGIRIVTPALPENGYACVRQLGEGDPDINAARISLGVLGVISQVTLKLEPMFKRSMSLVEKEDSNLGDEAATFGTQHEFGDMSWLPSEGRVVYRIDGRVPIHTPGDGRNDFIGFRSLPWFLVRASRTLEQIQESVNDADGKCFVGKASRFFLKVAGYGFTNNGDRFTGYPIIGYQNRLQSSGSCLDNLDDGLRTACPWDQRIQGLFFHQTTFSISLTKVKRFIANVQKLVSLEPKAAMCGQGLYGGILMRYVKASTAYLGKQEDAIDFDITYYRSKDPMSPRLYQNVIEEIEQLAIFKYGALPHWGKNRNVAFIGAIHKYPKSGDFLKVKDRYDPAGLFSSDWTDQVLGLKQGLTILKEGCALEGLCICSEDSHCAPSKGYFCMSGKVYKGARVCVMMSSNRTKVDNHHFTHSYNYCRKLYISITLPIIVCVLLYIKPIKTLKQLDVALSRY